MGEHSSNPGPYNLDLVPLISRMPHLGALPYTLNYRGEGNRINTGAIFFFVKNFSAIRLFVTREISPESDILRFLKSR